MGDKAFPLTLYILIPYKKSKRSYGTGHKRSITFNELMCTFHHIQFEGNSKRLFFMHGMFLVTFFYFMDKVPYFIVAVSINSYYLLVAMIIALRAEFILIWQHVYSCSSLRYTSLSIYRLET